MITDLIERVTASGVILSVQDGKLRGRPADKLAPFASELKRHRSAVIAYLGQPKPDPDEWAEAFTAWLNTRCVWASRFSTNVASLYRDFVAWCAMASDAACDRTGFESLLTQIGFTLVRVDGVTLVEPLGMVEDVEAMKVMSLTA